jgi:polar amino acid transport system substrate-binding protein
VISAGTERSKVELGEKSLIRKAQARPDLVRKVVDRARTEGVLPALSAMRERLDAVAPLGYSSAGIVLRIGTGVEGIVPGDHVACGGGGFANHAEVVAVPKNLTARIPHGVSFENAAYATIGAIALHGFRRAEAQVGESVGVIGLGLVGQLAARIVKAAGCTAIGIDLNSEAVELAQRGGASGLLRDQANLTSKVLASTNQLGLDAVLVCAASRSPDPVRLAAELARERGRIVLVGDVPVEVDRALMYEKELELRLSRSYGPGRYDRDYEERGTDMPPEYVRWTEQRNLQAFLDLIAEGKVDPRELTTHRFPVEQVGEAYATLTSERGRRPFGIVLEYAYEESQDSPPATVRRTSRQGAVRIGVIGAGSFARRILIPALKEEGAALVAVATESGLTAADVASRFDFERVAAANDDILADDSIDAIVIATRHSNHAALAAAGLAAGKAVFVEKPLALEQEELAEVNAALKPDSLLMVGFNRRFAPLVVLLKSELEQVAAPVLLARVNAGPLPDDHWVHDRLEGGGRLLGEACHFVDLLSHLAGSPPVSAHAVAVAHQARGLELSDDIAGTLRFENGAVATLLYTGSGDPQLPKERVEAFGAGLAAVLDDFRRLDLFREGKRTVEKRRQDKGHRAEVALFLSSVRGETEAPSIKSYFASTRATLGLAESLNTGAVVELIRN